MNKFLLFSFIIIATFSLTTRDSSHLKSQFHFLDGQLCQKNGGTVCGFVKKDCCAKGCDSKLFGMNEQCIEGKHLDLSDAPQCKQLCTKNNGTLFKNDLLSDEQCCITADLKDKTCPQKSVIDISKCGKGTLASKIVGLINNHHLQN